MVDSDANYTQHSMKEGSVAGLPGRSKNRFTNLVVASWVVALIYNKAQRVWPLFAHVVRVKFKIRLEML